MITCCGCGRRLAGRQAGRSSASNSRTARRHPGPRRTVNSQEVKCSSSFLRLAYSSAIVLLPQPSESYNYTDRRLVINLRRGPLITGGRRLAPANVQVAAEPYPSRPVTKGLEGGHFGPEGIPGKVVARMRHAEQPQEGPLDRSNRAESVEFGRSVDLFGNRRPACRALLGRSARERVVRPGPSGTAGSLLGAHDVIEGGHPHGYGPDRYRRGMLDEVVVTASAGWANAKSKSPWRQVRLKSADAPRRRRPGRTAALRQRQPT